MNTAKFWHTRESNREAYQKLTVTEQRSAAHCLSFVLTLFTTFQFLGLLMGTEGFLNTVIHCCLCVILVNEREKNKYRSYLNISSD